MESTTKNHPLRGAILLLLLFCSIMVKSQINPVNFVVMPQSQCYSVNHNTFVAYVTSIPSGAVTFSWLAVTSNSTCVGTVTSFTSMNAGVMIHYPCCGIYSITCVAYASGNIPIASSVQTVTVFCGSSASVTSLPNNIICSAGSRTLVASGASNYTWSTGATTNSIVVSPASTTCYSVSSTGTTGCTGSAVSCVSVQSNPTIAISGSSSACMGTPLLLNASGASTYTWNNGSTSSSISVTPSVNTCYTVTGASSGGCLAMAVKCLTINSVPIPTVSGGAFLCNGDSVTLNASGANSYTWLPGGQTSTSISVSPTASTCYTLLGNAGGTCLGSAVRCITVGSAPNIVVSGNLSICSGGTTSLSLSGASTYTWYPTTVSGSMVVLSPTATTCYSIAGTSSTGCNSYTGVCITVGSSPNLTVTGSSLVCAGQSTTLTAGGANSYTWLPGNSSGASIAVNPSVSTCYTVLGSNGSGCVASAVKCFSVSLAPVISISGNNSSCIGANRILTASGAGSYTWNTGSNSPSISVSPSVNTCYVVYGKNSAGCIGSASKCLTVSAAPSVSINGSHTLCAGSPLVLTASGANSYSWNTGATTSTLVVSPSTNTVYQVYGSNSGGCGSDTASYAVNVIANPTITVTSSPAYICAGQSATLNASGATSYLWNGTQSGSSIVVSPSVSTSYLVNGNTNGCSKIASFVLQVSPCTGIENNHDLATLNTQLYPNPAQNELTFQSNAPGKVSYQLIDLLGQVLLSGEFTTSKTIDVSGLADGHYIVRLEAGKSLSYKRLLIVK